MKELHRVALKKSSSVIKNVAERSYISTLCRTWLYQPKMSKNLFARPSVKEIKAD